MRIDQERGCHKISFECSMDLPTLQKGIACCAEQVDGLVSSGEVLREGEGFVFCIRHRESLKSFLEHAIFDLNQFMLLLHRLRKLLDDLHSHHLPFYDCVWDIDCVFVGSHIEDLEFVYLPGVLSAGEEMPKALFRISDLLAVISLRVYESQISALQALSEVIGVFSGWEDEILLKGNYNHAPFDTANRLLAPYCREQNSFIRSVRRALDTVRSSKDHHSATPAMRSKPPRTQRSKCARLHLEGIGLLKGRKLIIQGDVDIKDGESLYIGRDVNQSSMRMPYPVVSRNQAMISYKDGEWFLTDLSSSNGTFLDDFLINPGVGYPLLRGHTFYFAHQEIGYRIKRA